MTQDEWDSISLIMEECWQGEFPETKAMAYKGFLDRFTPEEIMQALYALAEAGSPFLPSVGEIVKKVRDSQEPPVPSWGEVWPTLRRAMRKGRERDALEVCEKLHAAVASFYAMEGHDTLRRMPFDDPDYGAFRVREIEGRWEAFIEVATERLRRGRALAAVTGRHELAPANLAVASLVENLEPEHRQLRAGDPAPRGPEGDYDLTDDDLHGLMQ
jgi:hypothetical protein